MTSDYILTSFKIEKEYYECPCGCCVGWNEDYEMFYALSDWKYCPKCGEKQVQSITEEQAFICIAFWFADIDLDEYKNEKGLDYSSLEWDFSQERGDIKVLYRSFDDFKKLIDKARKIDKCGA